MMQSQSSTGTNTTGDQNTTSPLGDIGKNMGFDMGLSDKYKNSDQYKNGGIGVGLGLIWG